MSRRPPAYEGDKPYIFISYAHKNSEAVLPAIRALEDAGYPVWYDAGIQVGSEWPEYIAEHLLHASLVIAFISEASIASPNCRQEIVYALDKRKPMITVHLEEVHMPPGMEMQLNLCQALLAYKHASREAYIAELVRAPYISEVLGLEANEEKKDEHSYSGHNSTVGVAAGAEKPKSEFRIFLEKAWEKIKDFFDTKDTTYEYSRSDIEENKVMGVLAYLSLLVLVPIFAAKNSRFAKFHANQGILLSATWIAFALVAKLIDLMTAGILGFILPLGNIALLAVLVFMIVNVVRGRAKELPIIGRFRILK